jgi:hypothetical protein
VPSTSFAGNDGRVARPARTQFQRMQERRQALIVGCGILFAVGLGIVLVIAGEFPLSSPPTIPSHSASAAPGNNFGSVKVMIDSADGNGCRQQVFDNQTWHMTRSQEPCDTMSRDSNGVPVPSGTIHRLDAVSKSFSGK